MRIGELAALVGITPRAVRHYHHLGLLPEPARRANGYREYGLREAVLLARIRRLTELGLGLDEVRDVITDDAGRELVEVLEELDDDLARQETIILERRSRLASLLAQARAGRLPAEGPLSPELTALLADLGEVPDSPMAAKDREHLVLFDVALPDEKRIRLMAMLDGMREQAAEVYRLLDALTDAPPDDPRVPPAAASLAALLSDEVATLGTDDHADAVADAFFADLAPAQAAVIRGALALVRQRRQGHP
ncbi:MerR family transcriptional regulator [Embleya sp. MST-111070]|uniref:MerR family transcriptional regulator n=1 Tax=Embleya sp. MST-111070 TaxID=3398231 RepID=UPI003F73DECD